MSGRIPPSQLLQVWGWGLRLGAATLRVAPGLGVKRLLLPVSYWRTVEFAYVARQLRGIRAGACLLDLGSPKELAAALVRRWHWKVHATDILPEAVTQGETYGRGLPRLPWRDMLVAEIQDGRELKYPPESFDGAYSVSVLEHIPDKGDSVALRELIRVVRPGAPVVITVPYARTYGETFVARNVYERSREGNELVFFERHYDEKALQERLLSIPGVEVVDVSLWGESWLRMERFLEQIGRLRSLLAPFEPMLAALCLRQLDGREGGVPMAAFITLRKLPQR